MRNETHRREVSNHWKHLMEVGIKGFRLAYIPIPLPPLWKTECLLVVEGGTAPPALICGSLWDPPGISWVSQPKVPVAVIKFLHQPPTVGKPYLDVCGRL